MVILHKKTLIIERKGASTFFFKNIISKTIFDLKPPVAGGTFEVVSRSLGHVGPTGPMGPQNSKFPN